MICKAEMTTDGLDLRQRLERLERLEGEARELLDNLRTMTTRCQNLLAPRPRARASFYHRVRQLAGVRLGTLWQHRPRPLALPARYQRVPELRDPPKISLVTPSFNQASYLEKTLESVLSQNYPRLEYIVQDGGSTDGSVALLEANADRLHDWKTQRDRGQAHALNLGFARTSGEILAYLNADDLLLPGSLHYVADYFRRHPEVDAVYGHRIVIDKLGREVGRWVMPPHQDEVLHWADYVPQETLFWRRSVWERAGGVMDESFQFALDWDLILRLQEAGARIVRLPRFLGAFRVHDQQKTSTLLASRGAEEMRKLRLRCHGREVATPEIRQAMRSYMLRSGLYFRLYQLGVLRY